MLYIGREKMDGVRRASGPDWPALFATRARSARHHALQAFYRKGMIGADTPLHDVPLVALDFETTGLDPRRHGIISVGLIPFDYRRIRCADARHWLVKPRKKLTADSITVHGITHSQIAAAPDLQVILEDLLSQLRGRVVVAHHGVIERGFLDAALKARIGEGIAFPLIDTMALEARVHRRQQGWWDRLRGRQPASIRLAQSRARYHLPHYRPHHALTDALACAELLQAQIAHRFRPDTPIAQIWQ
ncbi:MAG: 3'-5' exonuclease [Oceanococcaceae bacterium]